MKTTAKHFLVLSYYTHQDKHFGVYKVGVKEDFHNSCMKGLCVQAFPLFIKKNFEQKKRKD